MSKQTFKEKQNEYGKNWVGDRQNTKWYEEIAHKCKHKWQPLSFVFETQLLDPSGRVLIKAPDIASGRVYCVCMKCMSHTYVETGWVGYYIGSPDLLEEEVSESE